MTGDMSHLALADFATPKAPRGWQETPISWRPVRAPWAGRWGKRRSERHARVELGWVLARTEHQMRSLVSIAADPDSSLRKEGQRPALTAK